MGFDIGLLEIKEEAIEFIGEKLADLITDWKPA